MIQNERTPFCFEFLYFDHSILFRISANFIKSGVLRISAIKLIVLVKTIKRFQIYQIPSDTTSGER